MLPDIRGAVRDSGPGMPPESLDRVFEALYTANPAGMGMDRSPVRPSKPRPGRNRSIHPPCPSSEILGQEAA
jgi:hypothetical protein